MHKHCSYFSARNVKSSKWGGGGGGGGGGGVGYPPSVSILALNGHAHYQLGSFVVCFCSLFLQGFLEPALGSLNTHLESHIFNED